MNLTTLNDAQANYYYNFEAVKDALGPKVLSELTHLNYAPRFAHENAVRLDVTSLIAKQQIEKLQRLAAWLHPPKSTPLCVIVPSEFA
jgi:hypothetical protein